MPGSPWKALSKLSSAMECRSHPAPCLVLAWTQPGSFVTTFMEKGQILTLSSHLPHPHTHPSCPHAHQPWWLLFPRPTTRGAPMSLRCLWMLSKVSGCSMAVLLQGCARSVACWQWQNKSWADNTSGSSLLGERKQNPC